MSSIRKHRTIIFILILLSFLSSLPVQATGDLFENYSTGADTGAACYGSVWLAQTFTPSVSHTITSVKLKMYRIGTPNTLTLSIKVTVGGLPSGVDLTAATINANLFTTATDGAWYTISLPESTLEADVQYAIVIKALTGTVYNCVVWMTDGSSPTYSGGTYCSTYVNPPAWTAYSANDAMFEIRGTAVPSIFGEDWIIGITPSLGMDVLTAKLLMSLVFTVSLVLLALLATRGKSNLGIMLVGYGSIIFFTVLGWMPIFVIMLLMLITVGLYADKIKEWFGG
jgi:hypothetical protein